MSLAVGNAKKSALQMSLIAIGSVFVFEFVAGAITNSLALVTDGTHALLDLVVTAVLLIAVRLAFKPRDKDHTYGHGRIETIGAFVGGVALFVVSIVFIYEAAARIVGYGSYATVASIVRPGIVGYIAIAYTLSVDAFRVMVLRRALQVEQRGKSLQISTTLKTDMYHAITDMGSTAVALAGLVLVTYGFTSGDSIAAIFLGSFLAFLSGRFAYKNAVELSDSIPPSLVAKAMQAAKETPGVLACTDIKMRRAGSEFFVELNLRMRSDMSFEIAHETSVLVENNVSRILSADLGNLTINVTVHFEPDESAVRKLSPESAVERAAGLVEGVRGVHNIIISTLHGSEKKGVSLHIQVNRSATLSEAHAISNAVEDSIRNQVGGLDTITVHVEPFMPELLGIEPITDNDTSKAIHDIVLSSPGILRIGRIGTYRTVNGTMKIDIDCVFYSDHGRTVEQVHSNVSEIEKQILLRFPGSIVTIHAEPE